MCEVHPTAPGKMRVLSSLVNGATAGAKVAVRLPGCHHTVRITWPADVRQYLTFKLSACPQCPK